MSSTGKHLCKICKKEFSDSSGLYHHLQSHSSEKPYSCDLCSYTGKTKKYLYKHKYTHVAAKNHECSYCGRKFRFQSKLNEHISCHTNARQHKCDTCGKGFNSYQGLSSHKNIHRDEKPYKCLFCDYACKDASSLRKHHDRHTGMGKNYQCDQCLRNYKSKFQLRQHISVVHLNIDLKTLPCAICGKKFKENHELTSHIKIVHDKVNATSCDVCGQYISNRYNLKSHLRTHLQLRPFPCAFQGCGKRFKDKQALRRHTLIHYPAQQHACGTCGRRFTRKCRLRTHMCTHRPRTRHAVCDHCGVSFYSKNYLSKHILQKHILRMRYECDDCGFRSGNKPGLVAHIRAGHDQDLTCKLCKKVFKSYLTLKSHYWSTHFVRYKSRTRVVKDKSKEVQVEEELKAIEEEPSLNLGNNNHDIKQGSEAEAAAVKERMMNAVIATSDSLETLFRDLLPPDDDDDDEDDDKNDYKLPLFCEEEAQVQINEMLTKKQFSDLYGNKRKVVVKIVKIDSIYDYGSKSLERNTQEPDKYIDNQISNVWSSYNKNDSKHAMESGNKDNIINQNKINELKRKKENKKKYKRKINKETKKKDSDNDNKVKRNYTRRKLVVTGSRGLNRTDNKDKTDNLVSNESIEIENNSDKETTGESESEDGGTNKTSRANQSTGILLNSHQCYECFMLFETKEKLLEHCKEHYNLCNDVILKKCPMCDFVTHNSLPRHMKLMHKVNLKNTYRPILKEKENESGSRYFYKVDSEVVNKIEIIPSVKNLNKIAYVKLDRLRKEDYIKTVKKTKLVKKQGEWVVEKHNINIKDSSIVIPDLKEIKGDYFESLKKMATVAKKDGKKFLYPCKECEKICQTLSALKLHYRHHDPNKKPYKPKVWKHKIAKDKVQAGTEENVNVDTKRYEKPKPIVNKHKCDPKLMEFYENNIRGGDIEFWQFLKIYNQMAKDNVHDFKDLENTTKFGIHVADKTAGSSNELTNGTDIDKNARSIQESTSSKRREQSNSIKLSTTVEITRLTNKQRKLKRVVMSNRRDQIKRNKLKKQLREKICQNTVVK